MPRPTIIASRLMLMHSSLAYVSSELRTLDSIIQQPPATSNTMHLPPEILLNIRSYLLPIVTNHLMQRSAFALAQYEASLRDLLCSDCIAYNQFVYGPDVWQWEHFTGSCKCVKMTRSLSHAWAFNIPENLHVNPDPQEFTTAMDWFEFYLSLESSCLKRQRAHSKHSFAIWDVVEEVLRDHGCHILHDAGGGLSLRDGNANSVTIAALPSLLENVDEDISMPYEDYTARRILYQAVQGLSLSVEYEGDLQVPAVLLSRPLIRSCSHAIASTSPSGAMTLMQTQCLNIVQAIAALVVAWLSLPLTFATIAFTIFCFYSKPRSLRIL